MLQLDRISPAKPIQKQGAEICKSPETTTALAMCEGLATSMFMYSHTGSSGFVSVGHARSCG